MTKENWQLLRTIVFDIAKTLQDGRHSTAEEWGDIGDELTRAAMLAYDEYERLDDRSE